MVPTSAGINKVAWNYINGFHQLFIPTGSCLSDRYFKTSTWVLFTYGLQSGVCVLVFGSSESACEPFKSEVFSLQFYSFTWCFLSWFSKPAVWGFVSPMQGLGELMWGSNPPLRENSYPCESSQLQITHSMAGVWAFPCKTPPTCFDVILLLFVVEALFTQLSDFLPKELFHM